MDSGIRVDGDALVKFKEMLIRHSYKYIVLVIENDKCVIKECGNGGVDDLLAALKDTPCAFVCFDKGKYVNFFMYATEAATTNDRTIYSTTKSAVHKSLAGSKIVGNLVEDANEVRELCS
ncbi:Cofilin/actin-depolymerizing factor homolog 1 [Babesia microti strain RI]|uniref:Cofilin/actin-depolymerizing factor homolog 1 n=1 Tax=Babesia microti (strain RI) TaxID=1133968 RepID=A0A0K3ALZ1_BABMR|nr:Cofilin/actin-depolymerizing factor homolog 1 [Babesia microti strain RI]CTQ40759.1 Cofilin/actin-depolymerizing factor homolog 1 [Babesia microti strain RI]|eukprot:XP_012648770.1 Cofilin/actin-depolymerizing factor homolog 1 [Babesia microti strain RI]